MFPRRTTSSAKTCGTFDEQSGFGSNVGHTTLDCGAHERVPNFSFPRLHHKPFRQEFASESLATVRKPSQGRTFRVLEKHVKTSVKKLSTLMFLKLLKNSEDVLSYRGVTQVALCRTRNM